MKQNVEKLSTNNNIVSSTNILEFLDKFECDDDIWIDKLNKKLL